MGGIVLNFKIYYAAIKFCGSPLSICEKCSTNLFCCSSLELKVLPLLSFTGRSHLSFFPPMTYSHQVVRMQVSHLCCLLYLLCQCFLFYLTLVLTLITNVMLDNKKYITKYNKRKNFFYVNIKYSVYPHKKKSSVTTVLLFA